MSGQPVILAIQDTTSVNYDTQQEMEGLGYISDKAMGVNIHNCLAVTPEGLVLGMLDQCATSCARDSTVRKGKIQG
jgi:hypothetical protein